MQKAYQKKDIKNTYNVVGEITYLYDSSGNEIIIDTEDFEKVRPFRWTQRKTCGRYVLANSKKSKIYLHRYILGVKSFEMKVDHINHNPLDNRKSNLRVCTNQENSFNRINQNSEGVSYRKDKKKWRAYIMVNYKQISLGHYLTKEEAIQARKEGVKKYYGEYALRKEVV